MDGWLVEFLSALRRLWRHVMFRRLVAVRVATQASDGLLQVGMASYLLFNPQNQTTAWAIAAILAITLLPFSVLGPFVSIVLDRWNRRQIVIVTDAIRIVLALALAALVLVGTDRTPALVAFYGVVLVAMSINRFLLAGLSAALPHTIDPEEYLVANSVMPAIGPAGVVIGAGVAIGIRAGLGPVIGATPADALIFTVCAVGFTISVLLGLRIPRDALGPDLDAAEAARARDAGQLARQVLSGLGGALRHLAERRPAGLGLWTIALQRIGYGILQVAAILIYRNHFYAPAQADEAIGALSLWLGATGVGYVLSIAVTGPVASRIGLRRWVIVLLLIAAGVQVSLGSIVTQPTLVIAGFFLGIAAQSLKICVDTLVQAHVDDEYKGRVFVIYDMVFNATQVLAAVIAALILPASGVSVPVLITIGVLFAVTSGLFTLRSRAIGPELFERGTEDLHERSTAPAA